MAKEKLCKKVIEVRRISDRVMTVVVIVFEENALRLICEYALQREISFEEKQSFYDELKGEWNMHSVDDLVMCLGDFNGHVGRHIDGFDGDHGECGVGQRNLKGRMFMDF